MTEVKEASEPREQPALRGVLPAGTTLRGYELKSILGQGAFGITYRANDLTLDRDVAIKEYLPTSLALREGRTTVMPRSPDHAEQFAWGRERFLDEARTLARLDGTPAIVRVYDFLEDNGTAYMVMALIEGETLNKRLMREQKLTSEAIERLLFPLLDGLAAVHAIGFLHRDIKPANIMVDDTDRPTLIDFGASRAAMAERSTTLTAIFTPGYAAAEQFTTVTLGPWSDIYGLAATLYHAITGQIPPSAIDRILNDGYKPLSELMPEGFAPELLAGIDAGLAVRVDDRPQSIAEWRHMLRPSPLEATRLARKPGPLKRAASKGRKARITLRGPALWGSIAAAVVAFAGAGYLAMTANAPTTVNTAALTLSAEQLEQALAERRKADTLASEKRRLEDEARQKADIEAAAKRQADTELEQARQARQKAEQELAELKAAIEARRQSGPDERDREATVQRAAEEAAQRKAEAEAAALREAEELAAKKAEADTEAKRQADQALARAEAQRKEAEDDARAKAGAEAAARSNASEDAQRKAEAEAAARRQADEAQAKAQAERDKVETEAKIKAEAVEAAKLRDEAEAAERALRLDRPDRERLQFALTSLGFDTRGNDGIFGPRTREMIAAWQKASKQPTTGFLTGAQQQALAKEAAAALTRYDEQKKAAEEATTRPPVAAAAPGPASAYDGRYAGNVKTSAGSIGSSSIVTVRLILGNGQGSGVVEARGCNPSPLSVSISARGEITGRGDLACVVGGRPGDGIGVLSGELAVTGRHDGKAIDLTLQTSRGSLPVVLRPSMDAASTTPSLPSGPASILPDGLYTGAPHSDRFPMLKISLQITNGSGVGTVVRADCGALPLMLTVNPTGDVVGRGTFPRVDCSPETVTITGHVEGQRLVMSAPLASGGGGVLPRLFTLSMGAETTASPGAASAPPAATAAASPPAVQPWSPSDGTYYGDTNIVGYSGSAARIRVRLQIINGQGNGTLDTPGCDTQPLTLSIASTGVVTGHSPFNCTFGNSVTGPLSISGKVSGERFTLAFQSARASFRVTVSSASTALPASTSVALRSPDGLWRGTYGCDAGINDGVFGSPFSLPVEFRVANGSAVWMNNNAGSGTGWTLEIKLSVERNVATVERTVTSPRSGPSQPGSLVSMTAAASGPPGEKPARRPVCAP